MKTILLLELFLQNTTNQTTYKTKLIQSFHFKCNPPFLLFLPFQEKISHSPNTTTLEKCFWKDHVMQVSHVQLFYFL